RSSDLSLLLCTGINGFLFFTFGFLTILVGFLASPFGVPTASSKDQSAFKRERTLLASRLFFSINLTCSSVKYFPFTITLPFISSTLRSEEHTSELQSRFDLVCRLLLEKKKYS